MILFRMFRTCLLFWVNFKLMLMRFSLVHLCVLSFCPLLPSSASTIWLAPQKTSSEIKGWYAPSIQTLKGDVVEYTQEVIVVVDSRTRKEQRFASSRVIWIESDDLTGEEKDFRQAFEMGNDSEVLGNLPDVLNQRPPVWRQQWLTMVAAVSAWRTNRGQIALELIGQLDRRPLPLLSLAWVPLAWTNEATADPMISEALDRISDPSELVRLTASSWLLGSPKRKTGVDELQQLTKSKRPEIAGLAEILLWRIATPDQVASSKNTWEQSIASLPMVIQTGPLVLLMDKLRASGDEVSAQHLQWALEVTPLLKQLDWMERR